MGVWNALIVPVMRYYRRRRGKIFVKIFPDMAQYSICDLGGSVHFWHASDLPVDGRNVEIVNLSDSAINIVPGDYPDNTQKEFRVLLYDGLHLPRPDGHYDLLICNSVLEHVPFSDRRLLVLEMLRVSRRVILQTPAKEFLVDPHFLMPFIHWLPKSIGYYLALISPWRVLSRPSRAAINEYFFETNLLSYRDLVAVFPEADIYFEKSFAMTKSYIAVFSQ